jgi:hypothetical protein
MADHEDEEDIHEMMMYQIVMMRRCLMFVDQHRFLRLAFHRAIIKSTRIQQLKTQNQLDAQPTKVQTKQHNMQSMDKCKITKQANKTRQSQHASNTIPAQLRLPCLY